MKKQEEAVVRAAKIVSVVSSALMVFLGVLLIVWSEELASVLRFLFAVVALLLGSAKIFGYFSNDLYRIAFQFGLASGIAVSVFGLLLLLFPSHIEPYLLTVTVVYVLLDSVFRVQTSVDAFRFGMPYWYILLVFALLLGGGALVTVLLGEESRSLWSGLILASDGVLNALVTMYTVRVRSKKR